MCPQSASPAVPDSRRALAVSAAVAIDALNAGTADAASGDAILGGQANAAMTGTTLNGGNSDTAALILTNSAGAALNMTPTVATLSPTVGNLIGRAKGPEVVVDYGEGPGITCLATGFDVPPATIAFSPERVMDTRSAAYRDLVMDASSSAWFDSSTRVNAGAWIDVPPPAVQSGLDLSAVFLDVTAIGAPSKGNRSVYPSGDDVPPASNLNYPATTSIANLCFVAPAVVGDAWCVRVKVNVAAVHVILDFSGAVGSFPSDNQDVAGRAAQARRQKLTAMRGESGGKRLTKGLNLPQ